MPGVRMPRVSLVLSEQLSDLRSRRVIYDVTVENNCSATLLVRSINPRVGEQVTVSEVTTPADLRETDRVAHLCAGVGDLLRSWLATTDTDDPAPPAWRRRTVLSRWGDRIAETVTTIVLLVPAVALRILGRLDEMIGLPDWGRPKQSDVDQRVAHLVPPLYDYEGARDAVRRFGSVPAAARDRHADDDADDEPDGEPHESTRPAMSPALRAAFEVRLAQLKRLEAERGTAEPYLAELLPDSLHTQTLELDFRRGWLTVHKHTITIEVRYTPVEDGSPPPRSSRVITATRFVEISPNPVLLTLTALAGAVLGTLVRAAAADEPDASMGWAQAWSEVTSNAGIMALVLAVVFFNVFEFTTLAARLTRFVNWRGALLIGVLCGVTGERILAALQGPLGG